MKRYIVKGSENKEYKNIFGVTDYDIPMFGFKSALLIVLNTLLSIIICIHMCTFIGIDFRIPNAIISGLVSGFSVASSQFFIETKKGICKNFWIVGSLLSCVAFLLIFMVN